MDRRMNYTDETTAEIVSRYKAVPTRDTVDTLAAEYSKSVKSIIGKLSKEGVYRREIYKTKTGALPITKLEIVENIADHLGIDSDRLIGLDKTPKGTLVLMEKLLGGEESV
jgi:hypothetical protein